jgi:hypothetical protein
LSDPNFLVRSVLRALARPNPSLKLTRLSPRLYLGGWAESGAGQRGISGKPAAQLSSTVRRGAIKDCGLHESKAASKDKFVVKAPNRLVK